MTTIPFADLYQVFTNGHSPSLSSDLDGCRRPQQLRAPQPHHEVNSPAVVYPTIPATPQAQECAAMAPIGTNVQIPLLHPSMQNRGSGQSAHAWGSEHNVQAQVLRAPGTVTGPSCAAVQQGRLTPAAVRASHNGGTVRDASRICTFSSPGCSAKGACR